MGITTTESIVAYFEKEYGITLLKMRGKKIIYKGHTKNDSSIVVVIPYSKIYQHGNGWVDLTKIQIDICKQSEFAIAVFNLSNGTTYYVDMKKLFPLLTTENMLKNDKEGKHWKLDIWTEKIVIRNGGKTLPVKPNDKSFIQELVAYA